MVAVMVAVETAAATAAANAVESWIAQRGGAEATLIWEALRQDVRVYADLAQAEGELVAMASAMAG